MIRLGLRLTFASGREAALRLLVTAAAVALGVGLLLACVAGVNALNAQADRGAWLDTSAQAPPPGSVPSANSGLWWLSSTDQFGSQAIDQVDVAAAGPDAPVPPGIPHLPGPGEYYASPALSALIKSVPANQLSDRYPAHQIGTIGAAALPSPESLIIVIGHTARQLSQEPGATEVGAIQRTPANCYACQNTIGSGSVLQFILVGGAVALLLPVLILIATASRLSAARREERFAAMRLVGATPRQISVVSAVEAMVAAVAGVAIGFALFLAFRPLLYHVPFTGAPFGQGDLSLNWIDIVLALVGVPFAAVVSARLALRRVRVSPLGVKRQVSSRPPRIVRIIPLLTGIAVLAYFDAAGKPGAVGGQLLELLLGFVLLVVGLVLAGPWFTTAGSRFMAKRANGPAALIAGRRLLDNPKAAFRFISGLVIALFVTSTMIGALSSITATNSSSAGSAGESTLADTFCSFSMSNCPASAQVPSVPTKVLAELRATPGVRGVTVVYQSPFQSQLGRSFGYVACDQLAKTPAIGKCAPGETVASVGYFLSNLLGHNSHASSTVWPSAPVSAVEAARLPVDAVVVATDGSAGLDRAGANHARRGVSFPGRWARGRCARSLYRAPSRNDPGHDRRDHRGEPHHRRLQSRREHRRRVGRAEAPVQLAQAHRSAHGAPASCRRAGECATTPPCRRSFDRGRSGVGRALPPLPGRNRVPHPRNRVLGDRLRWTCRISRDHRLDIPASEQDDRARGRPKRLNVLGTRSRRPS